MRRRDLITWLGGAAVAWPLGARAQSSGKVWRIGFISGLDRPKRLESASFGGFLEGMRQLGYAEGKDFIMEWRFADGRYERFSQFAAELVQLNTDIIVVSASAAIRVVQQATSTIPIVMGYSIDPVSNGLVASLARPGGNTTGLSSAQEDIVAKHLELLATIVPGLSRVGIMANPANPNHPGSLKKAEAAASQAALTLVQAQARNPQELENALASMNREGVGAALFIPDSFFNAHRHRIAEFALEHRLPTMFGQRDYVEAGGLMSYGESFWDFFRRAAAFVDKMMKGAKPAELPIEQPARFFLVVSLKTAKAIGLAIPEAFLLRADEVIE